MQAEPMPKRTNTSCSAGARRKKPKNRLTRDVDSVEFAPTSVDLYDGPKVTIIVQAKKFNLPKRLLCHSSAFFEAAFSENFKEGHEQELSLTDFATISAFELAIKWMYTGLLVIPVESSKPEQKLTHYIEFFKLADFLQLLGPFTGLVDAIKTMLVEARSGGKEILTGQHIRNVMKLPSGNLLRDLIIKACVLPYMESIRPPNSQNGLPLFKFAVEMKEVDAFACDLFRSFDDALHTRAVGQPRVQDPLTGFLIKYL